GDRRYVGAALRGRPGFQIRREAPDDLVEGLAGRVELACGAGICDRGVDLLSVADDALVGQQPGNVPLAIGRDLLDVEAVERPAEVLALAQDGEPGEPGLEGLESQALVEVRLAVQRPTPLGVVVVDVVGRAKGPPTARLPVRSFFDGGIRAHTAGPLPSPSVASGPPAARRRRLVASC